MGVNRLHWSHWSATHGSRNWEHATGDLCGHGGGRLHLLHTSTAASHIYTAYLLLWLLSHVYCLPSPPQVSPFEIRRQIWRIALSLQWSLSTVARAYRRVKVVGAVHRAVG